MLLGFSVWRPALSATPLRPRITHRCRPERGSIHTSDITRVTVSTALPSVSVALWRISIYSPSAALPFFPPTDGLFSLHPSLLFAIPPSVGGRGRICVRGRFGGGLLSQRHTQEGRCSTERRDAWGEISAVHRLLPPSFLPLWHLLSPVLNIFTLANRPEDKQSLITVNLMPNM